MRLGATIALLLTFSCFSPVSATAEDSWGGDPTKEHPGVSAENRIIRWCADSGTHERFASANIEIKDYHPCGELKMPVACDPIGRRIIGNSDAPYTYKSCDVGPRIVITKTVDPTANFRDKDADGSMSPSPLTSKERTDLAGEIRRAKEEQAQHMDVQLQVALEQILQNLISVQGYDPLTDGKQKPKRKIPSKQRRFSDQQIDELIRYVDPKYQRQLERILRTR